MLKKVQAGKQKWLQTGLSRGRDSAFYKGRHNQGQTPPNNKSCNQAADREPVERAYAFYRWHEKKRHAKKNDLLLQSQN